MPEQMSYFLRFAFWYLKSVSALASDPPQCLRSQRELTAYEKKGKVISGKTENQEKIIK